MENGKDSYPFFTLYDKSLPQELNHLVADACVNFSPLIPFILPFFRLEGEADDGESEDASPAYQAREKLYQVCIIVPCRILPYAHFE